MAVKLVNKFKEERLQKKITIKSVAKKTCYPIYIIEAIESERTDFLPKPYAYYCAKTYAEFLEIKDIKKLLKKFL